MNFVLVYVLGAAFGTGLLLCATALYPAPQPLGAAIARLHRTDSDVASPSWRVRWLGSSWADTSLGRRSVREVQSDLTMCGLSHHDYLAQRAAGALIAALWAPLMALIVNAVGFGVPVVVPVWVSLLSLPVGFVYPTVALRTKAKARRRAFRHSFSSFLDIVSVSLAGGKGVEGALADGADAGDGWVFERIRACLLEARLLGMTPWAGLQKLGEELAVPAVQELAASAALAGAEGARVRKSIAAKAKSLRSHSLADIEASAQSANERMSLPIVALMMGFVLFLGYPAVMAVIRGL